MILDARALVPRADHTVAQFCPHWPSAADGETGFDYGIEEGVPSGVGRAVATITFGLFEGVVDRYRKGRVGLFGDAMHCLCHAIKEESLRLLLAAMTVGNKPRVLQL